MLPADFTGGTDKYRIKDGFEGLKWLRGTEVDKELHRLTENGTTILKEIDTYYYDVAQPVLLQDSRTSSKYPHLQGFYHAYTLVSSRAFLVDAFHGLSMVPIADTFNHVVDNHVHLESDYNVCPECGSLNECRHDRDGYDYPEIPIEGRSRKKSPTHASDHDSFYEMVSDIPIPPHSEVFNTYGETLTNAQLLTRYGFILDVNENDHLTWTLDDLYAGLGNSAAQLLQSSISGLIKHENEETYGHILDLFPESQLVYRDDLSPSDNLCINSDGKLSYQLWITLALLAQPHSGMHTGILESLKALLNFQLFLEEKQEAMMVDGEFSSTLCGSEHLGTETSELFLELARSIISLCDRRRKTGNCESSPDLGELLDVGLYFLFTSTHLMAFFPA
ncbi:hypothetical protein BDQ12DRAFT_46280 [Crucibulum laeve]|uniref:SET domain-containing protein n=1 Tax=Crucibulum laeve TaxID=68775 RepID=A0A5C3MUI0_9AGAR|nr:hypothetical protein BDQ12DRAFT_46280 [Crucibulum laeve]